MPLFPVFFRKIYSFSSFWLKHFTNILPFLPAPVFFFSTPVYTLFFLTFPCTVVIFFYILCKKMLFRSFKISSLYPSNLDSTLCRIYISLLARSMQPPPTIRVVLLLIFKHFTPFYNILFKPQLQILPRSLKNFSFTLH